MFRSLPVMLMVMIVAVIFLNPLIPLDIKQILYAVSLTIKSFIVFLLPFIIFGLLFKTAIELAQRATAVIILILLCVCCSNFTSTFISHYMGEWIYHLNLTILLPKESHGLTPAWSWQFPQWIANDKAMFLGIILGIIFGKIKTDLAHPVAVKLDW